MKYTTSAFENVLTFLLFFFNYKRQKSAKTFRFEGEMKVPDLMSAVIALQFPQKKKPLLEVRRIILD